MSCALKVGEILSEGKLHEFGTHEIGVCYTCETTLGAGDLATVHHPLVLCSPCAVAAQNDRVAETSAPYAYTVLDWWHRVGSNALNKDGFRKAFYRNKPKPTADRYWVRLLTQLRRSYRGMFTEGVDDDGFCTIKLLPAAYEHATKVLDVKKSKIEDKLPVNLGVVYEQAGVLYLAVDYERFITVKDGKVVELKPWGVFYPVKDRVEELAAQWGVSLDFLDEIARQYFYQRLPA